MRSSQKELDNLISEVELLSEIIENPTIRNLSLLDSSGRMSTKTINKLSKEISVLTENLKNKCLNNLN